jgi:hypothetical protein
VRNCCRTRQSQSLSGANQGSQEHENESGESRGDDEAFDARPSSAYEHHERHERHA